MEEYKQFPSFRRSTSIKDKTAENSQIRCGYKNRLRALVLWLIHDELIAEETELDHFNNLEIYG